MLAIGLLIVGILSRFIIHVPNFTPVISIALFSGVYLKKRHALLLAIGLMAMTDILLGLHKVMFFTWGSLILIVLTGLWVQKHKSLKTLIAANLSSAVLFFIITNFGVWLVSGLYEPTFQGLGKCFTLAIPFFRNTLASTLVYSCALFSIHEFIAYRIKNTRYARVLLTT